MKFSPSTPIRASIGMLALASQVTAFCFGPEPPQRICYSETGATPQNITLREITYVAGYLRYYGSQPGNPQFYTMPLPDADNCAEWQVTSQGSTWVLAKLVGNDAASITFDDLANTIDGGAGATAAEKAAALYGCDTAGGQMGVQITADDPRYQEEQFLDGTYTNEGIVIKLVRNPDV